MCFNNYTSKDANGQLLKYYRLPRSESIHEVVYDKSGMNWAKGHICGSHWSKPRGNSTDLPDIVPDDQYDKICEKHTLAKKHLSPTKPL